MTHRTDGMLHEVDELMKVWRLSKACNLALIFLVLNNSNPSCQKKIYIYIYICVRMKYETEWYMFGSRLNSDISNVDIGHIE